jgi:hypothetical protein
VGQFGRKEIEDAFTRFQEAAARCGRSGDWSEWADCFTEDAEYYEHHYGRMRGRPAILAWIHDTMSQPINREMRAFPIDWHVIDEERGWVICQVQNVMDDPGDGSRHAEYNWTLLHYAGDGRFSYEEDMYNPKEFGEMITGWLAAKRAAGEG